MSRSGGIRFHVFASAMLALFTACPAVARAQPLAPADVPPPLRPWIGWALDGVDTYGCTWMPGHEASGAPAQRCVWPGELAVAVEPGGARFEMSVWLDREGSVRLPGDPRRWPLEVRADGALVPVRRGPEGPVLDLAAGEHRIEGRFSWTDAPETLAIPPSTGRIALRVPEGQVARPRRDATTLWLQTASREAAQEDTLAVEVFRRIEDGVPLRVSTRIMLRVAGRPREIALGRALLEGTDPISVRSDAPVRMTESGELTLQVQAGAFEVEVVGARSSLDAPLTAIARSELWPSEEIWVWSADEALRQVELSGADRIDPDRTNLPDEWRGLPTYLVPASTGRLEVQTTRRGNPAPPPNQVSLSRELWLDPDGTGFTGIDRLSGQMHQRWRLELAHGVLGRATVDGAPHLISTREGRPGVEVRRQAIDVRAEWRDEATTTSFAAVGWDEDVQNLVTTLHMAPGFRLIAAGGVDDAATWLARWDLWGLFFVLVISLAVGRLAGPVAGATALAVLVLSYHQPDAPFLIWIPLVISLALATALPRGWFREGARWVFQLCFAMLCLLVAYFAVQELRRGLWPYTSAGADDVGGASYAMMEEAASTVAPAAPMEPSAADMEGGTGLRARGGEYDDGSLGGLADVASRSPNLWSYEPNAVLQTGPGVPSWQARGGETVTLRWDGPVTHDTAVRLWVITPLESAILSVIEVALFGLFLFFLYRRRPRPPAAHPVASPAPAAVAAALLLAVISGEAHAQENGPSPILLENLRQRLARPPRCGGECADLASMTIAIEGARLVLEIDAQASALAAVPVPGPLDAWSPETIAIDGVMTRAAARIDDGYLYVRVPQGAHRVRLEGALPSSDAFTLSFAAAPHHVAVRAVGWEVDGIRGGDQVGSSLQLRRAVRGETAGDAEGGASIRVTPWLELERSFALGIRWEATTTVRRISAAGAPIVARIPLLPGESVLASDLTIENGAAVVTLGGNETERTWTSVLTPREALELSAPEGERRSEVWLVSCGTVWRCETEGLDPVRIEEDGLWRPRFRPFPGDTLRVLVSRLPAAEGQSMTIDGASLHLRPGERLTIAQLSLEVRSSVGSTQTITLPEGAVLQSVTVNGERRAVEQRDRQVRLTIAPGATQVAMEWQEPRPLALAYRSSAVLLSGGAVNATITIERPSRWILWLAGPAWGPVVLFWPYLAIILVVALVLANVIRGGLSALDWALLALGLSLLPWQVAWIVPSWVAVIEWRRRTPDLRTPFFELRQLVILGWSLVAAIVLYAVIHVGLLIDPDTSVEPAYGALEWYVDRLEGPNAALPEVTLISAPTWVYHVVMLLWSLWLAARLIAWSRWAFRAFGEGGMWRGWPMKSAGAAVSEATPRAAAVPEGAAAGEMGTNEPGRSEEAPRE